MKTIITFFAVILLASNAFAIIVDTPNSVGMYWDTDADLVDDVDYSLFMTGYIIITNPTFNTFQGIELSIQAKTEAGEILPLNDGVVGSVPVTMGTFVSDAPFPECVYTTDAPIVTSEIFSVMAITLLTPTLGLDSRFTTEIVEWFIEEIPGATIPGAVVALPALGEPYVELVTTTPFGDPVAFLNHTGTIIQPPRALPFSDSFDSESEWHNYAGDDFKITDDQLNWNANRSVDQKMTRCLDQSYGNPLGYSGNFLIEFDFQFNSTDNDIWLDVGLAKDIEGSFSAPANYPVGSFLQFGWMDGGTPDGVYYVHALGRYADEMSYDGGFSDTDPSTYIAFNEDAWYHARMEIIGLEWEITLLDEMQNEVGQLSGIFPKEISTYRDIYIGNPDDQNSGIGSGAIDNVYVTTIETPIITAVDDPVGDLPLVASLHSCYPNPFNPSTTLSYDLSEASQVNLNIYDVSGRLVRELISAESKDAGRHAELWNGRNEAGKIVSAGVYFYKLETAGFSETRKMTLVK